MANKVVKTRIKNRYDLLSKWQEADVELLQGEIALVAVPTGTNYSNPVTGEDEPVVELLMKVGQKDSQGNPIAFDNLPWLSAKASDVYDWAKLQDPGSVTVKYKDGSTDKSTTLADLFKKVNTEAAALDTVEAAVANFINSVSKTGSGIVKSVAINGTNKHQLDVTCDTVGTDDIADDAITAAKIATGAVGSAEIATGAVGTDELASGAVTNAKVASGISGAKINYTDKETVAAALQRIDGALADVDTDVLSKISVTPATATADGVVQGITYNSSTGTFTASYDTVKTADIADAAVTTAKINDSAVTTAKINNSAVTDAKIASISASKVEVTPKQGETAAVYLPAKLQDLAQGISDLQGAISGGTHFRGELAAAPTNVRKVLKKGSSTDYLTAEPGDIVLYGEKEYICTAVDTGKASTDTGSATWKELGDLTRVGNVETLLSSITASSTATTNQFVTNIKRVTNNNKTTISVETARPTVADVLYKTEGTTKTSLETKLGELDSAIAGKMDIHTHNYSSNTHTHGNISNTGTLTASITDTAKAKNILLTDSNNKITSMEPATVRSLIGAGTSSLTLGTTADTAAKGDHGHEDLANIKANYVRFNEGTNKTDNEGTLEAVYNGTAYTIIFDCGGADA